MKSSSDGGGRPGARRQGSGRPPSGRGASNTAPRARPLDESMTLGRQGVLEIRDLLFSPAVCTSWRQTLSVVDLDDKTEFQQTNVDLLWGYRTPTGLGCERIEVKTDSYHTTGNFFFETVGDLERDTPGCFLVSKADWWFYYFIELGLVYALPFPPLRAWFQRMEDSLRRRTSASVHDGRRWRTAGQLAPVASVLREVAGIHLFAKDCGGVWQALSLNDLPDTAPAAKPGRKRRHTER